MTFNVLWLQSGGCGGCSMSLLCADTADFPATAATARHRAAVAPLAVAGKRRRGLLDAAATTACDGRTRLDALCIEGVAAARPATAPGASTCWPAPACR